MLTFSTATKNAAALQGTEIPGSLLILLLFVFDALWPTLESLFNFNNIYKPKKQTLNADEQKLGTFQADDVIFMLPSLPSL